MDFWWSIQQKRTRFDHFGARHDPTINWWNRAVEISGEAIEAAEAAKVKEAEDILRPGKSLLRTSRVIQVLELRFILMFWNTTFFGRLIKYQVWFLQLFLSEAVEAGLSYCFEKWWINLKCPYLLNILGTIIQGNYWSFYPSEPFTLARFNMKHPVLSRKLRFGSLK